MNTQHLGRWIVLCTSLLLAGAGTAFADEEKYSGFISDYSGVEKVKGPLGEDIHRMVSPRLTPDNYHALIVEKVQFYPEPKPTEKVSQETLNEIVDYINDQLKVSLANKVELTDQPGPGVARLRLAVTGVGAKVEGLKPYQFIPVALVLTTVKRAALGAPEDAKLYLEAEVSNSVSGERTVVAVTNPSGGHRVEWSERRPAREAAHAGRHLFPGRNNQNRQGMKPENSLDIGSAPTTSIALATSSAPSVAPTARSAVRL
jgi:hypothetical protein